MTDFSKSTGIVAEYNPFHNGHKYHIDRARELFNAPIVAVMSGNFVQRGEPALFDKQLRAQTAVQNGIDLVLELPTVFATCSAEHFAAGAVRLLDNLGIINHICCGAENEQLLAETALTDEIDSGTLKKIMKSGISYANAMVELSAKPSELTPNNILAIEYQRAIRKFDCKLKLHAIRRIANAYHEKNITGQISSATAIRAILNDVEAKNADWSVQMPENCANNIAKYLETNKLCHLSDFENIISYKLRTMNARELAQRFEISEGLENRFVAFANSGTSVAALLSNVKSRRYTYTRLQRFLIHLLLDITRQDLKTFIMAGPLYIRPLAWTTTGEQLLKQISRTSSLPIITQPAKFLKNDQHSLVAKMLNYDITATKIQSIVSKIDPLGDFHNMPFIIK